MTRYHWLALFVLLALAYLINVVFIVVGSRMGGARQEWREF